MKRIGSFSNLKSSAVRVAICASCAMHLAGCSCFMPWHQDFVVAGTPNDADVSIVGEGTRRSGGVFSLRRDRYYRGTVSKPGYQEEAFYVTSGLNGVGVLDVVGGCCWFVPLIGLGFPGSHSLDRDHYFYDLKPIPSDAK